MIHTLKKEELYHVCDTKDFTFNSTSDLEPIDEIIGQKRAAEAITFAAEIKKDGYNLFAMGPTGSGKHTAVMAHIQKKAKEESAPYDICYVNNFIDNRKPNILVLPSGKGSEFRRDIDVLTDDLLNIVPLAFESDDYRQNKEKINEQLKAKENDAFSNLQQKANNQGISFMRSAEGYGFAPNNEEGNVLTSDEYNKIGDDQKIKIQHSIAFLQKELQEILREITKWKKETQKELKEIKKEISKEIVKLSMDEIKRKYNKNEIVIKYLDFFEEDVVDSIDDFLHPEGSGGGLFAQPRAKSAKDNPVFKKYMVNLFICHEGDGAPVIYEDSPSYQNLIGNIENIAQFGTLLTDFTLIKPGAFHKANGGYLILDARKLLMQPYGWEGLKRVLRSKEVRIESLEQLLGYARTTSLEPEPVKIDLKVVLVGERRLYYLLNQYDPDFSELFKVVADFEDDMQRESENNLLYARMIATVADKHEILPLTASAVGKIIEHSSRMAGDINKLSTYIGGITEIMEESDYLAKRKNRGVIGKDDIEKAIDNKRYRNSRIKERMYEMIEQGTIMIDTKDEVIGQVNGLSVIMLGDQSFGRPSKITAKTRLGLGKIIDIEREVELGGPIHSKGVMILSSFIGSRYAQEELLSLTATIVFEQSYGGIEGDSASSAELYSILSSLADVPIKQSFAVTGSVNQHGHIQPIGGVNEKIEGFFDVCCAVGLTGEQGVIIPKTNVRNLMLKDEVLKAVENKKFAIYAVETIDEGISLLTGKKAGIKLENGEFEEGSINALVENKLKMYAAKKKEKSEKEENSDKNEN